MTVEQVARITHEANRALCEAHGDNSQQSWDEAPDWQKKSAINGVKFNLVHPEGDPELSHENWLKEKEAEGWKYGPVKDPSKKEHPCFRPYDELPPEQQAKDWLFSGIVLALAQFIDQ